MQVVIYVLDTNPRIHSFQTHWRRYSQLSTPSQMSKHTTAPAKEALRGSWKKGTMPHS